MAYEFYAKGKMKRQGATKPESSGSAPIREAHKDQFPCYAIDLGVTSPRDIATGQASGKRLWKPIKVRKEVGPNTPLFMTACATNEIFENLKFDFIHTTNEGVEETYFTVEVTNATISSWRLLTGEGEDAKHGESYATHENEEIELTFQKIEIHHVGAKTSGIDDWVK